jgi:hypothetical protein
MGMTRRWFLLALGSLTITAVSAAAAQGASLVEHNAIPNAEHRWSAASFSSMLESSGPPEFGRCIKTVGGAYEDSGCTTTGTGKSYEWYSAFGSAQPLVKTGFSNAIKEGTTTTFETVSQSVVSCTGESATGEYTGNKTVGNMIVTFTGCKAFGTSCTSEGAATGTVVTYSLEGVLGIEELGAEPVLDKIGEALFPVGHSGPIAELTCGGVPMAIAGTIISPVTANAMKLSAQVKSKAVKGKQRPENFVGEPPEVLTASIEGSPPEQAGETLTTIQTNEEKIEINSVL